MLSSYESKLHVGSFFLRSLETEVSVTPSYLSPTVNEVEKNVDGDTNVVSGLPRLAVTIRQRHKTDGWSDKRKGLTVTNGREVVLP